VLRVVAGRELVAPRALLVALGEAVHLPVVPLEAPAVPGVVGVAEVAPLEVGREAVGLHALALAVDVREAAVAGVRVRVPAKVVVERAVLHHQDDEGVDRDLPRVRQGATAATRRLGDQPAAARRG
jgi:hypothetical protein